MSYTREQWSYALLQAIGNTSPSLLTINFVVGWTDIETSGPGTAQYNLLNTTEVNTPGVVSNYNSVGVKNYDTFEHGIQANAKVLQNGFYPNLCTSLRHNVITDTSLIESINNELSTWGTGPVYNNILSLSGHNATESFTGNGPDPTWRKYGTFTIGTGIYHSWLASPDVYGSPLSSEQHIDPTTVLQYFEHADCFWLNGNAFWRMIH